MNTIRIEKLVHGGLGLCRSENGVVLIAGAMSGEVVEYEITETQGGTKIGRAVKIVESSPHRREPPCVYAGECGGCDWLFMQYEEQVRCKKEIFMDCVKRIGKFDDFPQDMEIFTADEFGYRLRAQIKIDHKNRCAGFFKRKTNDVVKIEKCPLLTNEINDVLTQINSDIKMFDNIPQSTKVIKMLSGKTVASYPAIKNLTSSNTEIDISGIKFLADGGSFFQSNKFLLETMGRWFANGESNKKSFCLDLYGGIGFFSLMLSDIFEEIVLVENVPMQVRAAERNFRHNNKTHIKAIRADIDKIDALVHLTNWRKPDCIIVDPPRPGLTKSARKLLTNSGASVILYVSCNPSTFARDAAALVGGGYRLTRQALFDLYPNTHHIESAAVFCR